MTVDIKDLRAGLVASAKEVDEPKKPPGTSARYVGAALGYGILFLPFVFAWGLWQKGYSTRARVLSTVWAVVFLAAAASGLSNRTNNQVLPPQGTAENPAPAESIAASLSPEPNAVAAPPSAQTALPPSISTSPSLPVELPKPVTSWSYSVSGDEMRNETTRFARNTSKNSIALGFPYGDEQPQLVLRQRPKDGLNVMLIGDAQFVCSEYSRDYVAVKFDDGPIENFGCSEPQSAASDTIFINRERSFVEKLRKAKTVIIEAMYYDHGPAQLKFEVAGLDW